MTAHSNRQVNAQHIALMIAALVVAQLTADDRIDAATPTPFIKIVDIIPESLSGESDFNVEPDLSVNPANLLQIAASAWIPEPLGGKTTPIFISLDGGEKWSCRSTVPINADTADKTLQFGGLLNMLYVAAGVENQAHDYDLGVFRSDRFAKRLMELMEQRPGKIDQPYVAAATIDKKDRAFVGYLYWKSERDKKTAIIDRSLDGTGKPPASDFMPVPIDFDDPLFDSSEIRPAISADRKKVYAVFSRVFSVDGNKRVGDVVLVRDDDGGNSPAAFTALRDPSGVPGFRVKKRRTFLFDDDGTPALLGRDRLGGDLAIAVDPRNADNVYVVWGELVDNKPALRVMRSNKSGTEWLPILYTVTNAKNPGLAVNANGTVAFLYQEVTTDSHKREIWKTQLVLTKDDFTNRNSLTLAEFPAAELDCVSGQPRLGDYLSLTAMGNDFYGIFPSSNVPDRNRFPCLKSSQCQVTLQRKADFNTRRLLDLDENEVQPSIDPFFFKVSGQ